MIKLEFKSFKLEIKRNVFNSVAYTFLTLGTVVLVPNSFNFQWWEYLLFNDYKFEFNPNQIDLLQLILGVLSVISGLLILRYKNYLQRIIDEDYSNSLIIIIRHQGLGEITLPNFRKKVSGKSFKRYIRHEILIDEIELDKVKEYQTVIQNQINILAESSDLIKKANQIAYFGISRIPLTFLLGNLIGNNSTISIFDFNRESGLWNQISYSYFKNFLKSKSGFNKNESAILNSESKDLVITISVSYSVDLNATQEIINSPYKRIDLEIINFKNGFVDRIKSHKESNLLKFIFKDLLDEVSIRYLNIEKIHLFYAGPNSLAFLFGAMYSDSIHKKLTVYNYNINDSPKYSWGININDKTLICNPPKK